MEIGDKRRQEANWASYVEFIVGLQIFVIFQFFFFNKLANISKFLLFSVKMRF